MSNVRKILCTVCENRFYFLSSPPYSMQYVEGNPSFRSSPPCCRHIAMKNSNTICSRELLYLIILLVTFLNFADLSVIRLGIAPEAISVPFSNKTVFVGKLLASKTRFSLTMKRGGKEES